MGFVSKFMGSGKDDVEAEAEAVKQPASLDALADGAIDTLSNVMYVMGQESFPLEDQNDGFPDICTAFSRHVENGAAIPSFDIPGSTDGTREWSHIRRFYADRRTAEKTFVTERLQGYRSIVDDLVSGLRDIGVQNQNTEDDVLGSLSMLEEALKSGALPKVKDALSQTISQVTKTFEEQKSGYEKQLQELNERMSSMRQDLVQAHEEMKRDPLTDAFNRGAFDAAILQCLNMHFILQVPVTVMMIDLDEFKAINDTHGHSAGDEVLRSVSECLARSFIRKNDIVARYGGDEFAVILSDTSAIQSASLIDRFLELARGISIPNADCKVTCSVGYTEVDSEDSVEDLVNRADRALYAAKSAGRDRSVFLSVEDEKQGLDS